MELTKVRQLIRDQHMFLLVGAGMSVRVGYPTLDAYAKTLVEHFGVPTPGDGWSEDGSVVIQLVKDHVRETGRLAAFYRHLESSFDPSARGEEYDSVHRLLVRANFRGIATTNYDSVLEDAARADRNRAEEVDLCMRRSPVFEFMRESSASRQRSKILHFHGYFRNPRRLVLTARDYYWRYGPYEVTNSDGTSAFRWREGPHAKMLWWLFATYPVLFVGFSMRDIALRHILEVVDQDFERGGDLDHYAVMGAKDAAEEELRTEELARYGVKPIFYRVNPPAAPGRGWDHGELEPLLMDLCRERKGVALTTRMLA